jgi:hypothetical protein
MADNFTIRLDKIASKEALNFMEKFPHKMEEATEIALFRIGQEARNDAGDKAPYKKGNLMRSITTNNWDGSIYQKKRNQVQVGTKLDYAAFQEYRNKTKSGFFRKAVDKQINGRAEQIYSQEIETVLKYR